MLDDEKGILIAPVIREGRPDKGMPKLNLTEAADCRYRGVAARADVCGGTSRHIHFRECGHRRCEKGRSVFQQHWELQRLPLGQLAIWPGIAGKYDPLSLQGRWLQPRSRKHGKGNRALNYGHGDAGISGKLYPGALDRLDDFTVSLRDADGHFHSFSREDDPPKVVSSRSGEGSHGYAAQVHRRRYPQRHCLPGDLEMNS